MNRSGLITRATAGYHPTARQVDWLVFGTAVMITGSLLIAMAVADQAGVVVSALLLPMATVPLLWRRSRPGLTVLVLAAAFGLSVSFGAAAPDGVGLLFGVYAAALYGRRHVRIIGGFVAAGLLVAAFVAIALTDRTRVFGHLTGTAIGFAVAWVYGDRTRAHRAYLAELEERARRLEIERDEHARRAAESERSRIARELHDVVTHNVSVIAVQAGAARATADAHPHRASEALALIERTARETLTELRAQLGVLRRGDSAAALRQPQPGLEQLDDLVLLAREAELGVRLRIDGQRRPLPSVVDLCAYRVIQEALTNIVKHAPGANINILVEYSPAQLRIVVVDDGPGPPPGGTPSTGHGLIGMRERVALAGGRLRIGPALGGGFRIEVGLPLSTASPSPDATQPLSVAAGEPTR
jgi:signal transduction histidine kinase